MATKEPRLCCQVLRVPWRWLKRIIVIVFVTWHLFFLFLRNPLDLWGDEIFARAKEQPWWQSAEAVVTPINEATRYYGVFFGIEQGWCMFGAPLARAAPFPAVRIYFSDGTYLTIYSDNEPDPTSFLRLGGNRQRKLEDYLSAWGADQGCRGVEWWLWRNYALHALRRWRLSHPQDDREPVRLQFVRRVLYYLEPGTLEYELATESTICWFYPNGEWLPNEELPPELQK